VTEEWRAIPGWEGCYEVSSWGRVRSLPGPRRRPGLRKLYQAKRGGYLAVSLCRENRSRPYVVHKLVALAFLGPRPEGLEVRHLDGDPLNPHLSNLKYGTSSENKRDLLKHGRHHHVRKTHCPHGHPYSLENTYVNHRGWRWCNTCRRQRQRRNVA
jgi:hypothetical protein